MRGFAGVVVLALAAAGCRAVPAAVPEAGGYRGVQRLVLQVHGME